MLLVSVLFSFFFFFFFHYYTLPIRSVDDPPVPKGFSNIGPHWETHTLDHIDAVHSSGRAREAYSLVPTFRQKDLSESIAESWAT